VKSSLFISNGIWATKFQDFVTGEQHLSPASNTSMVTRLTTINILDLDTIFLYYTQMIQSKK